MRLQLVLGAIITLIFIVTALFGEMLITADPYKQELYQALLSPNADHIMGQDRLGRDLFARIVTGARISLFVGFTVVLVSSVVGSLIGILSALSGGIKDQIIMRLTDIFLAFPGILLAMAIMAILDPGISNLVIALSLVGWTSFARLARGEALIVKEKEFVIAAIAIGASRSRIIFRHILPNIIPPILVEATFAVASAIVAEAGLSFLGLGVQAPDPSWGSILSEGRKFILIAPHLTIFPGIMISLVVMGVNFLGDGLRDLIDPKS